MGEDVKTSYAGRLLLVMLVAGVAMSARTHAASISTVYDMDRMLFEPHPMADEYGTRWTSPPKPPPVAPIPLAPVPLPAPAPPPAAAPKPVVTPAPVSVSPKFELSPRLSIDTDGLDVDVVKTAPPPPPPEMPVPAK